MPAKLLVCVATELEGSLLRARANVLVTGVGAVNAAYSLTRFLSREAVDAVVVCGIGGAYPRAFDEGSLAIGDVICAESECYGDLGADSDDGFLDMQALGFPLIEGADAVSNVLSMQIFPVARRGRFVTMNTCSGTDEAAIRIAERTGGIVESMEGAAIAHVARLFGIPCGEVRGISNRAGKRDRASWRIQEAAVAAQESVLKWLREEGRI